MSIQDDLLVKFVNEMDSIKPDRPFALLKYSTSSLTQIKLKLTEMERPILARFIKLLNANSSAYESPNN